MRRLASLIGLLPVLVWALVALPLAPVRAADAPKFPELSGRVVDDAHVLSPQVQADLTLKLARLEQSTSRQLVVVTLPSLQGHEIEDYGYQLLRHWGIGQKGLNNGALFIIAPAEHKVRIEVGYGLEATLTDAMSSVILQREVLPKFKSGDIAGGVTAGTDALIQQLGADPATAQEQAAEAAHDAELQRHHERSPIGGLIPLIILFVVVSSLFRTRGNGGGGIGWLLPLMFLGGGRGWGGRDDGWGGGGGGGDWGGGGFSGGGGSGGGGGASGGW